MAYSDMGRFLSFFIYNYPSDNCIFVIILLTLNQNWKQVIKDTEEATEQINRILSDFSTKHPGANVFLKGSFSSNELKTVVIGFTVDLKSLTEEDILAFSKSNASVTIRSGW